MKKALMIFLFCFPVILAKPASAVSAELPTGFFSLRGGLSQGSATYQNISDTLNGWNVDFTLGLRPAHFLKLGLLGEFENNTLSNSSGPVGPMSLVGYGLSARLFFVGDIFIEGEGGQTQARLANSATGNAVVANGTFYLIGSGIEIPISSNFTVEMEIRTRDITFPQGEFKNTAGLFYSLGFSVYF